MCDITIRKLSSEEYNNHTKNHIPPGLIMERMYAYPIRKEGKIHIIPVAPEICSSAAPNGPSIPSRKLPFAGNMENFGDEPERFRHGPKIKYASRTYFGDIASIFRRLSPRLPTQVRPRKFLSPPIYLFAYIRRREPRRTFGETRSIT